MPKIGGNVTAEESARSKVEKNEMSATRDSDRSIVKGVSSSP